MSRSRKKVSVYTDSSRGGYAKRQAAKAVRRYKGELSNGKEYRKLYNPWNICDWKFLQNPYDIARNERDVKHYQKGLRK
jgi:hypothetical protein